MASKNIKHIQNLFEQAVELSPPERKTFLEKECGKDSELLKTVLDLLNADESSHSIFQEEVLNLIAQDQIHSYVNKKIGPYRIIRELGSGGMGVVYLAEREDEFEQQVAVKLLKRGMDSHEISKRFQSERQILARLQHSNIARLLDGGVTEDGLPYFTMEYVKGIPIDKYCQQRNLSLKERLNLFQTICSAVQYAHRNLLIHRDLKPANILVTEEGEIKLLDFGIAKVLSGENDNPAKGITLTQAGMRMMTPEYASPEQVRGEIVDTSTDIYSLGVILYKLLTGIMAYNLGAKSFKEIEQVVLSSIPEKPSAAVKQASFKKLLSGDLDNICLMALKKETERRYISVEQFNEDITRFLNEYPVLARPDAFAYRTQKYIQRNKRAFITTLAVMIMVISLVVFYTMRLADERDKAIFEAKKSEQITSFLTNLFKVSTPSVPREKEISARELLDSAVVNIESELEEQQKIKAQLLHVMGEVYRNIGLYDEAADLLSKALALTRAMDDPQYVDIAKTLRAIGQLYEMIGKREEAIGVQLESIEILNGQPDAPPLLLANSLHSLAVAEMRQYQLVEAEKHIREALEIKQKILGDKHEDVAHSLNVLGDIFVYQERNKESEKIHLKVLEMRRDLLGDDHLQVGVTLHNLAGAVRNQGRNIEAEDYFRQSYAIRQKTQSDNHPDIPNLLSQLAVVLRRQGRIKESEEMQLQALALFRKIFKSEHPQIANSLERYAYLLLTQARYNEAEKAYSSALQVRSKLNTKNDPNTMLTLAEMANAIWKQGRFKEAEKLLKEADNICGSLNDIHPTCDEEMNKYFVELYEDWGRLDEAEKYR